MSRIESTHEAWPFQPWPALRASALRGWSDDTTEADPVLPQTVARGWLLLALVPILVVGLAGAAVAHLLADDAARATPENSLGSPVCIDQRLEALMREHRRAVHDLE